MKRFLILVGLAVLLMPSCNDESPVWLERTPIFRVIGPNQTEEVDLDISGRALTLEFIVLSTEAWSATVDGCDDFVVNPQVGGVGRTVVSLNTSANLTGATRNVLLTFATETDLVKAFSLEQEIEQPYLEINPNTLPVFGFGGDFTIEVETNQENWSYSFDTPGADTWIHLKEKGSTSITFTADENNTGLTRSAIITFESVTNPEAFSSFTLNQGVIETVPTDLILDVLFAQDGTATDQSPLQMTIDDRRNADNSVKYVDQFGLYAACFNNQNIARSSVNDGFYTVPYTTDSEFARKIADGCTIEVLFCTYYDPLTWFGTHSSRQIVKPFASTQGGGMDISLRAGNACILFECHVKGSTYNFVTSSVVPTANRYYHAVGVYDKTNMVTSIYVDGKLEASENATHDFKFPTASNLWFGIGADPNGNNQGEATFYGEVVIARIYDSPMTEGQVAARYHEIMK